MDWYHGISASTSRAKNFAAKGFHCLDLGSWLNHEGGHEDNSQDFCYLKLLLLSLFRQVCQLLKRNANQNAADDQGQVSNSDIQSYLSYTFF